MFLFNAQCAKYAKKKKRNLCGRLPSLPALVFACPVFFRVKG
jgi:hypothetical protein